MALDTKVKKILLAISVPSAFVAWLGGWNLYNYHNASYETEDSKVISKVDGLMNHTQLTEKNDGSIVVNRFRFFGTSKYYTDKDGDQEVDMIHEISDGRGGHSSVFYRGEHLQKYPDKFQRADQDFRQQIARFKPYLHR